ncbi:DUF2145 domain-containing protein [Vampirovibrio sp.]|uniref:DUF2145 domain-containing protein n=1 Tax=Vampirovibrio sp. TaxID=2717857 RepID=UPI0035942521
MDPGISAHQTHGDSFASLPVKPFQWGNPKKLALAEAMSSWTIQTLRANHAQVGVVARQGAYVTRLFDRTGMTHSGFVFQDPTSGEWMTYSLYSNPETGRKTARLWRQSLKDFFYGQRSNYPEALLLIPTPALQARMLQRFYAEPFESLLPPHHRYNLVAPIQSPISFNCTKWVVLQLYAAQNNSSDVPTLIQAMRGHYGVKTVRPKFLTRLVLKRKADVDWEELNPPGTVQTVTVDSLYQANLFERFFLYSGKPKLKGIWAEDFNPVGEGGAAALIKK